MLAMISSHNANGFLCLGKLGNHMLPMPNLNSRNHFLLISEIISVYSLNLKSIYCWKQPNCGQSLILPIVSSIRTILVSILVDTFASFENLDVVMKTPFLASYPLEHQQIFEFLVIQHYIFHLFACM